MSSALSVVPMRDPFPLPLLSQREYPSFVAMTRDAPAGYELPTTYEDWTSVLADRRLEREQLGYEVHEVPVTLDVFRFYCEKAMDDAPSVASLDSCCRALAATWR